LHQLLGEDLARFYLGGLLGRTENRDTCTLEVVNNTLGQRCFGSDNSEVNLLFPGYFSQRFYIGRLDIQVMGYLRRAGITRSDIYLLDLRALG